MLYHGEDRDEVFTLVDFIDNDITLEDEVSYLFILKIDGRAMLEWMIRKFLAELEDVILKLSRCTRFVLSYIINLIV